MRFNVFRRHFFTHCTIDAFDLVEFQYMFKDKGHSKPLNPGAKDPDKGHNDQQTSSAIELFPHQPEIQTGDSRDEDKEYIFLDQQRRYKKSSQGKSNY